MASVLMLIGLSSDESEPHPVSSLSVTKGVRLFPDRHAINATLKNQMRFCLHKRGSTPCRGQNLAQENGFASFGLYPATRRMCRSAIETSTLVPQSKPRKSCSIPSAKMTPPSLIRDVSNKLCLRSITPLRTSAPV